MDFRVEEIRLHCKLFHFERAFTLLNLIPFEYSAQDIVSIPNVVSLYFSTNILQAKMN